MQESDPLPNGEGGRAEPDGTDSTPKLRPSNVDTRRALREELARLRLKLEHSTDRDIRAVLQLRIDQILQDLPVETPGPRGVQPSARRSDSSAPSVDARATAPPEEEDDDPDVTPLTPAQVQEVDRLVQRARVEKMRGNAVEATSLLQQAAALAPASAPVLEALGDNLMERRQLMPAIRAYKRARRLNPKNVGLEEKLATAVLQADASGSVESQLRQGMSDSPFLTSADIVARTPYAVILSVICPGAGHLALGKTGAGFTLLVTWVICWIMLVVKHEQVRELTYMLGGKPVHVDTSVFATLFVMVVVWLGALASLKPRSVASARRTIERPIPPANLPFE